MQLGSERRLHRLIHGQLVDAEEALGELLVAGRDAAVSRGGVRTAQ